MNDKLYHGTCKAFVEYAKQQGGRFGPNYDTVSFTPDRNHAESFADGWNSARGIARLKEMFVSDLDSGLAKPVILSFSRETLGKLNYRNDCGNDEFYVPKGPVNLSLAEEILEL